MAGRGTRLRPHTLQRPKPLLPIAGKPIVERLLEDLIEVCPEKVDHIAFIVGEFGAEVEAQLIGIAERLGAKGTIHYQLDPKGTAHAIACAPEALDGPVLIAFADTLFKADFKLDAKQDGTIWVQKIKDPSAFGVVKLDGNNITGFVEKPQTFVSDLAIIGIYYFRQGEKLKAAIDRLIAEERTHGGEYGLTTALEMLLEEGLSFAPGEVKEWLDCGNAPITVETNGRYLGFLQAKGEQLIDPSAQVENSVLIPPVYLGAGAVVRNSVVGPNVSLGDGAKADRSLLEDCLIEEKAELEGVNLRGSLIGRHVKWTSSPDALSLGDYTKSL